MKCFFVWILFFLISIGILNAKNPNKNKNDSLPNYLSFLKNLPSDLKVVGLGEATHGTKEFSLIKNEIVKYLVIEKGFRNFILEASYIDANRLNNYIQAKDSNINFAFKFIPWPFVTNEVLDLLNWFRDYNLNHIDKITFWGTDVGTKIQLIRINEFYKKDSSLYNYYKNIYFDSSLTISYKRKLLNDSIKKLVNKDMFYSNNYFLINYLQTIYYELFTGGTKRKLRESFFAYFTINLIRSMESDKFILWAHNIHIIKKSKSRKVLGEYLNHEFGKSYFNIGFDFNKGCFRAYDIDSGKYLTKFDMKEFCLEESNHNIFLKSKEPQAPIRAFHLPSYSKIFKRRIKIRGIGAVFGNQLYKNKPKLYYDRILPNKSFDYLIIVDSTSPSVSYPFKN